MKVNIGPYVSEDKKRKIKIKIDNYDVWNADHTLALIILPVLKKIKKIKHGSPSVDMKDVPERLRCEPATADNNYNDKTIHKRWNYVLKKMITAFDLIVNADMIYGDETKESKKIKKGLKLFAKYYMGLWD